MGRAVGAFAFGIGLLVWFLVFSKKETELTPLKIDTPDGKEPITKIVRTDHRGFAWLFTAMVSYVVFESVMQNWLPTFLQEARGKTAGDASLILTVFWVGLGITRLSYAFFKKKSTKVPLLIQALILLVSAVALAMTSATTSPILIIIIIGFIGIGAGPIWPLIVEHCSDTYQNESLVMYLVAAGSIGGIVGPSLSSLVFSYAHISYMSILLVGYHLICVFTIIIATKERKHV
ncbi:MAG: MFS transporter [Sphaerochaetaceae bacterium]|nr:MFS transporter [Sphaerochaetaceae bacterium]